MESRDQITWVFRHIGPLPTIAGAVEIVELKPGATAFGRGGAADVYIDSAVLHNFISRRHAVVVGKRDADAHLHFVLHNYGLNGTYVNDVRMGRVHPLKEGDKVTFGHTNGYKVKVGETTQQPDSEFQFVFECQQSSKPSVAPLQENRRQGETTGDTTLSKDDKTTELHPLCSSQPNGFSFQSQGPQHKDGCSGTPKKEAGNCLGKLSGTHPKLLPSKAHPGSGREVQQNDARIKRESVSDKGTPKQAGALKAEGGGVSKKNNVVLESPKRKPCQKDKKAEPSRRHSNDGIPKSLKPKSSSYAPSHPKGQERRSDSESLKPELSGVSSASGRHASVVVSKSPKHRGQPESVDPSRSPRFSVSSKSSRQCGRSRVPSAEVSEYRSRSPLQDHSSSEGKTARHHQQQSLDKPGSRGSHGSQGSPGSQVSPRSQGHDSDGSGSRPLTLRPGEGKPSSPNSRSSQKPHSPDSRSRSPRPSSLPAGVLAKKSRSPRSEDSSENSAGGSRSPSVRQPSPSSVYDDPPVLSPEYVRTPSLVRTFSPCPFLEWASDEESEEEDPELLCGGVPPTPGRSLKDLSPGPCVSAGGRQVSPHSKDRDRDRDSVAPHSKHGSGSSRTTKDKNFSSLSKERSVSSHSKERSVSSHTKDRSISSHTKDSFGSSRTKARAVSPHSKARAVSPHTKARAVSPHSKARAVSPHSKARAVSPHSKARAVFPHSNARAVSPHTKARTVSPHCKVRAISPHTKARAVSPGSKTQDGPLQKRHVDVSLWIRDFEVGSSKNQKRSTQNFSPPIGHSRQKGSHVECGSREKADDSVEAEQVWCSTPFRTRLTPVEPDSTSKDRISSDSDSANDVKKTQSPGGKDKKGKDSYSDGANDVRKTQSPGGKDKKDKDNNSDGANDVKKTQSPGGKDKNSSHSDDAKRKQRRGSSEEEHTQQKHSWHSDKGDNKKSDHIAHNGGEKQNHDGFGTMNRDKDFKEDRNIFEKFSWSDSGRQSVGGKRPHSAGQDRSSDESWSRPRPKSAKLHQKPHKLFGEKENGLKAEWESVNKQTGFADRSQGKQQSDGKLLKDVRVTVQRVTCDTGGSQPVDTGSADRRKALGKTLPDGSRSTYNDNKSQAQQSPPDKGEKTAGDSEKERRSSAMDNSLFALEMERLSTVRHKDRAKTHGDRQPSNRSLKPVSAGSKTSKDNKKQSTVSNRRGVDEAAGGGERWGRERKGHKERNSRSRSQTPEAFQSGGKESLAGGRVGQKVAMRRPRPGKDREESKASLHRGREGAVGVEDRKAVPLPSSKKIKRKPQRKRPHEEEGEEDERLEDGVVWYEEDTCESPHCNRPAERRVQWVCCDDCDKWYHTVCVDNVNMEHLEDEDFHCGCADH